jgi:predicted DNA-binding transcriptional regulator AlpA
MHRLMRLSEVLDVTGLSKSALYRLQKSGDFPHSIKLANTSTTRWPNHLVEEWVIQQNAKPSKQVDANQLQTPMQQ